MVHAIPALQRTLAVALVGAGALAAGAVLAVPWSSSASDGCAPYDGTIVESTSFTPYSEQRDHVPETPLNPTGEPAPSIPPRFSVPAIDGVPRQWASDGSGGSVYQYYLDRPLDSGMTLAQFEAAGGLQLSVNPRDGSQSFVAYLRQQLGDRVTPVQVADVPAALIWADPESSDELRQHGVYWDDEDYTYSLELTAPPEAAVSIARTVACALDARR